MAFARAIGEYGSVIFIAGNMPMVSEITPLIIIGKLEQYDYAGATAIAVVMLVISFVLLLVINALQAWQRRRSEGDAMSATFEQPSRTQRSAVTTEAPVGALHADRASRWPSCCCSWCCRWRRCSPRRCARASAPTWRRCRSPTPGRRSG